MYLSKLVHEEARDKNIMNIIRVIRILKAECKDQLRFDLKTS